MMKELCPKEEKFKMMKSVWNHFDYVDEYMKSVEHRPLEGYKRAFLEMASWLQRDQKAEGHNYPLLLIFEEKIDQLLFMKHSFDYYKRVQDREDGDFTFYVKGSAGGCLSRINLSIYNLIVKLRETFNLKRRVPLCEDDLRRKLSNWLELASKKLIQSVVLDSRINLVFESVEKLTEEDKSKPNLIKYYLPAEFPHNINCILTTQAGSFTEEYFSKHKCSIVRVKSSECQVSLLLKRLIPEYNFNDYNDEIIEKFKHIRKELRDEVSFASLYFEVLLLMKNDNGDKSIDFVNQMKRMITINKNMSEFTDSNQFVNFIIERISVIVNRLNDEVMVDKDKIIDFLIYTNLSIKGLSMDDLRKLSLLSIEQIEALIAFFAPLMTSFNGFFKIRDSSIIEYISGMIPEGEEVVFHKRIGEVLEHSSTSVRKLEEQMYAYTQAKEFFQVKQIVSLIENFLFLFNPHFKIYLIETWIELITQNYDPVIEYNKNLELFVMHNQPTNENMFYIVLQLSRFFKELADFEDSSIPEFRHPKIFNRLLTIKNVTKEDSVSKSLEELSYKIVKDKANFFVHTDILLNTSDVSEEEFDEEVNDHLKGRTINYLLDIGVLKEMKRLGLYDGTLSKTTKGSVIEQTGYSERDEVLAGYETAFAGAPSGYQVSSYVNERNI